MAEVSRMQTQPDIVNLNPPLPRELWLKRLTYRSWHRGCKETDIVLGHYCERHIATLSDAELALFEAFLDEDDSEIWNWLTEKIACPKLEYSNLIAQLRTVTFTV
jgi:antitoxin CptB